MMINARWQSLRAIRLQAATLSLLIGACSGTATRSEAAPAARPFEVAPVASFSTPWAMAFLPGQGALALVTEKEGALWLVDTATGKRRPVGGAPKPYVEGQGGLGDVVPGPSFARDGRVYLSFIEQGPNKLSGAAVGYGRLVMGGPGADAKPAIEGFRTIWRQSPKVTGNGHFSHRIAFAPDGRSMFLTSGDRQKFDPAQDLSGTLGKVLRLDLEGRAFPGNPWAAKGGASAQAWSIGHRNLLGIAFAPDGRLWESEMGPKGGDEVNLIAAGKNYGWPIVSNGDHYDGRPIPDHPTRPEFAAPKAWWNPSISPAGMIVYSGNLFPQWKGDILLGGLSGEALLRIDVNGERATKAEQWSMNARIREVEQGPGGEVFLLEDGGRLLRLTPRK